MKDIQYNIYIYVLNNIHNISNIDLEGAAGAWATLKSERRVFPVIWAQLPKKGFNIDPPSVKLFFQNRNQGGYGHPSISNLTACGPRPPLPNGN